MLKPSKTILSQLLIVGSIVSLSACTPETPEQIQVPESWQAHLKPAKTNSEAEPAVAETIYVPCYSHIYYENTSRSSPLAVTLSLRNTDPTTAIVLKSVKYYGTDGKMLQELCPKPVMLDAMSTAEIVVPRTHLAGGSGANFVVDWTASKSVSEPIAEAVMISAGSAQTFSFVSRGVVVSRSDKLTKKKSDRT